MILYVFNNYFPNNGGFTKRCIKEIEILSSKNNIIVLCRKRKNEENLIHEYKTEYRNVSFYYFTPYFALNKSIVNYNPHFSGIYEIIRNLGLALSLSVSLTKLFIKYRSKKIKLYSIVSPLTVPLITNFIGRLFKASSEVIEFHDLEPEMAIHMKNLDNNNLILKIEYLFETIACRLYKNVVVTSNGQRLKLIERVGLNKNIVHVIPNSIQIDTSLPIKLNNNKKNKIVVGYVSSFSYSYTIDGLKELITIINKKSEQFENTIFYIVGDGELLPQIKNLVTKKRMNKYFYFTGRINNVNDLIDYFDIAIIPWRENIMSNYILPTKLFEYMALNKVIIAPNFGEFKTILKHGNNSLLFNTISELVDNIISIKDIKTKSLKLASNSKKEFDNLYRPEKYYNKINSLI